MKIFLIVCTFMITSLQAESYTFARLIKPKHAHDMISFVQLLPHELLLVGDRKDRIEIFDLKNSESIEYGINLVGHLTKATLEPRQDNIINLIILNSLCNQQYFHLIAGLEDPITQSKFINESKPSEEQKQILLNTPDISNDEHGSFFLSRDNVLNNTKAIIESLHRDSFNLNDHSIYSFHKTATILVLGHDGMISVWKLTE